LGIPVVPGFGIADLTGAGFVVGAFMDDVAASAGLASEVRKFEGVAFDICTGGGFVVAEVGFLIEEAVTGADILVPTFGVVVVVVVVFVGLFPVGEGFVLVGFVGETTVRGLVGLVPSFAFAGGLNEVAFGGLTILAGFIPPVGGTYSCTKFGANATSLEEIGGVGCSVSVFL